MSSAAVAESPVAAEPAPKAEPETWRPLGAVAVDIVADLARARIHSGNYRDTVVTRRKLVLTRKMLNLINQGFSWLGDLDSNQD
jgi:hypothetical protein